MNTQKGIASVLLILLGLVVIGGGVYIYVNNPKQENMEEFSFEPLETFESSEGVDDDNATSVSPKEQTITVVSNDSPQKINNGSNNIEDGDHYVILTGIFKENEEILISFDLVQRKNGQEIINENPLIRTVKTSKDFKATKSFQPFDYEKSEWSDEEYNSEQVLLESNNENSFGYFLKYKNPVLIRIESGHITNLNPGYWPG